MNDHHYLSSYMDILILEKKKIILSKLIKLCTFFYICSKTRRALHKLNFMFVNKSRKEKWPKKCSLHFFLTQLK